MHELDAAGLALIENWQRNFPLTTRPYEVIASSLDMREADVIAALDRLIRLGIIARIGAAIRPNTVGVSQLAAMRVPAQRLEAVAEIVNREPGVNHNYEREHDINLWFVMTGASQAELQSAVARIRSASGLDVITLPLERGYFIDLGFPISPSAKGRHIKPKYDCDPALAPISPDDIDRRILGHIEEGLPRTARPFAGIARAAGLSEADVISRLSRLVAHGIITRFGLIVHHRKIGISANAMAVWDIDDHDVDRIGALFAAVPAVTLCYRRPRRLPEWPFNLFCMVHGRERPAVLAEIDALNRLAKLRSRPHAVLFSRRCFRQRGARVRAIAGENTCPTP